MTKGIIGYDANALYLFNAGNVMTCGKDTLVVNKKAFEQKRIAKCSRSVLKGKVFGFVLADIEVPDNLYDKFSEMPPLFVVQEIPDCDIPEEMKMYKEKTGRKTVKRTKKLLGVGKMIEDLGRHKNKQQNLRLKNGLLTRPLGLRFLTI